MEFLLKFKFNQWPGDAMEGYSTKKHHLELTLRVMCEPDYWTFESV